MFKRSWPLQFSTSLWFSVSLDSQTSCSSVSCRWCGKHYGPPSIKVTSCRLQLIIQEVDLETPFRYLGACMPQWKVLCIRCKVFIIGLQLDDSAGVWRQLIVHIPWIVPIVPWEPSSLNHLSLASVNGFHYRLVIRWCSCMFNFSSHICML